MSFLGIFGKKSKPNLTPDVSYPDQEGLAHTATLRDLFNRRVGKGQDLGFGEGYLDKATNPAIQSSQRRFQNETVPFLQNQLSARGVSRSAGSGLATDVLGKAAQEQQGQVDQLVSQFYHLNELQKKQDFGQALGVGENMQNQQAGMLTQKAAASERLNQRTQEASRHNDDIDQQRFSTVMQAVGAAMGVPISGGGNTAGGGSGGIQQLGNQPGIGQISTYGSNNVPQGFGGMSNPGIQPNFFQSLGGNVGQMLSALSGGQQSSLNIAGSEQESLRKELVRRGLI